MNPYRELGVEPTASIDEIEARYRLLMREHHPDYHQGSGPDGLAEAERRTRNLNWAMDQIRQHREAESETPAWTWDNADDGRQDGTGTGSASGAGRRDGPWAGENPFWRPPGDEGSRSNEDTRARDWFGNAIPTDEPVPCPFCRKPFDRLADYELHLREAHRFRDNRGSRPAPRPSTIGNAVAMLRYLPTWLVLVVAIGFWVVLGFFWFIGVVAFLGLVLWVQTSRRFRRR
jgi:hypothetical protein